MARDHDDAADLFAKAAKKSDDADVQAFATKTLPTLERHLQLVKAIKKAMKQAGISQTLRRAGRHRQARECLPVIDILHSSGSKPPS